MNYKAKKKFGGLVSVRDYIIDNCDKRGENLTIEYGGDEMIVPHSKLRSFQIHTREFISKYDGKPYKLYDFTWKPTEKQQTLL